MYLKLKTGVEAMDIFYEEKRYFTADPRCYDAEDGRMAVCREIRGVFKSADHHVNCKVRGKR